MCVCVCVCGVWCPGPPACLSLIDRIKGVRRRTGTTHLYFLTALSLSVTCQCLSQSVTCLCLSQSVTCLALSLSVTCLSLSLSATCLSLSQSALSVSVCCSPYPFLSSPLLYHSVFSLSSSLYLSLTHSSLVVFLSSLSRIITSCPKPAKLSIIASDTHTHTHTKTTHTHTHTHVRLPW